MGFDLCQCFFFVISNELFPCCDALFESKREVHRCASTHGSARKGPRNRSCQWNSRLVIWSRPTRLLFTPAAGRRYYSEKRRDLASPSDSIRVASYRMSTQSPTPNPYAHPSFFPTHALVRAPCLLLILLIILIFWQDHAFAGIGAGTVAVLCMNPLDLLKVKFQVSTRAPGSGIGRGIWLALRDIHASEGWRGLYRGLGPNVAGNASSWGLYFLLCVLHFISFLSFSILTSFAL